jgi:hypothetical protein
VIPFPYKPSIGTEEFIRRLSELREYIEISCGIPPKKQSSFYPCIIWLIEEMEYAVIRSRYDFNNYLQKPIRILYPDATPEQCKNAEQGRFKRCQ